MPATMADGARCVFPVGSQLCLPAAGAFVFRLAGSGRKLDVHGCARAEGTFDLNRATERFDPVSQSDQARASCRIGTSGAVIPNGDANHTIDPLHADMDDRGVGVLRSI